MAMFDVSDAKQERFRAYGPARLPCERDEELKAFVDALRRGGPPAVTDALARVSSAGRDVLRAYAERMAALAVRTKNSEELLRALIALVVGGLIDDAPEAIMAMALVEHSVRLLGIEPQDVFEQASAVVGQRGTASLVLWLARSPEDRSIEAMRFVEDADEDGFRYRLDW